MIMKQTLSILLPAIFYIHFAVAQNTADSIADDIKQFSEYQAQLSVEECSASAQQWVDMLPQSELLTYAAQAQKILYIPYSSHNQRIAYRTLLQRLLQGNSNDVSLLRYKYMYEMLVHNNEGDSATDFIYYDINDNEHSLSEHNGNQTLIIFNDPECEECASLRQHIIDNGELQGIAIDSTTTILVIYPDMPTPEWREAVTHYPERWKIGYSEDVSDLYDLRTLPSTYLLDDKHIITLRNAHTYITVIE